MEPCQVTGQGGRTYQVRYQELPAFDVLGFTKIVQDGDELHREVSSDGRWQVLRGLAKDGTIYGVASFDKECPKDRFRLTLGVKAAADLAQRNDLFRIHIKPSAWLIFHLDDLAQYEAFWRDDPYALTRKLGWEFNTAIGLHVDVFGPAFDAGQDGTEFMMPVRPPRK